MTKKRVSLVLLAIVLVCVGTISITRIPYQRIVNSIMQPKADAEEVVKKLEDEDVVQRRLGLDAYHYGLKNDISLQHALAQRVLDDDDEKVRQQALSILIGMTATTGAQLQDQPPLDYNVIEQIVSLLDVANTQISMPAELVDQLIQFAGSTAKWQTRPQKAIFLITAMLDETSPAVNEQRHAAYTREERHRLILEALKGYARQMMLPRQTLNLVLPIYTGTGNPRIRREAGYIFQYHAINGPLPANVREAVVNMMRNDTDQQIRQTAIMTMEWIGKQEGQTPPELLQAMKNETEPQTRKHISHVIIRMQKHTGDPVDSLLKIARDDQMPATLRAYALRTAVKDHGEDARIARTIFILTGDDETHLRVTAIRLLPDIAEQPGSPHSSTDTLRYIDRALSDPNPGVRISAIYILPVLPLPDTEKISRFERALLDSDRDVLTSTVSTISNSGLSSSIIVERLAIAEKQGAIKPEVNSRKSSWWSVFIEKVKDTRQHGVRLFWMLAATGVITAVFFAVYFVYRLLISITDGHRRSAFAAVAALIVWTGLTYAVVAVFVFGAFSFGHNSLVAPSAQFIIDAVVGSALLIYGFLGWAMRRLVLRQSRRID
jgi:HEAT repeat protein